MSAMNIIIQLSRVSFYFVFIAQLVFSCKQPLKVDVLLKNGIVVDGSGEDIQLVNIGIADDTISYVGKNEPEAELIIDASGLVVTPGFIDPHTHALEDLLSSQNNQNKNYLTQGVTSVFVGNDGGGPYKIDETTKSLMSNGIGTNVAFFVGHGLVRAEVLGFRKKADPTEEQLDRMRTLVRQGMEEGAFGLSTGLYYVPGSFAKTDEVIELAKEIVPFGGVYDSHIRDESSYNIGLIAAVEETIKIGRESQAPIHFAHIKALGVDVWGKSQDVIEIIEQAQEDGITVTADQYPWSASGTRIQNAVINSWVKDGGEEAYQKRLRDPSLLPRIREEVKENIRKRG